MADMSGVWNYKCNKIPSVYVFCRWDFVLWDCTSKKIFIKIAKNLAICQIYDIILFSSLWKWIVKFCKNKKMAKCNTFVTFLKILGKTYPSNPYKQGAPKWQGRNEGSPLKGIDTSNSIAAPVAGPTVEMKEAR